MCGGISRANLNILQALNALVEERRCSLKVFSFLESDGDRPENLSSDVSFRGFRGSKISFGMGLSLAAGEEPIFFFDHVSLALPVLPLAALGRVKTVIFAHGSEAWGNTQCTSQWSWKFTSLCLADSNLIRRRMMEQFPNSRIETCLLGLSPEFTLNESIPVPSNGVFTMKNLDGETRPLGRRTLLLVARMDQREGKKGHRALIRILPDLLKSFPDVQLVFPGPGDDCEKLVQLARFHRVSSSIFMPGRATVEVLRQLYSRCYAFVMPSLQEGFGLVYLEAMNFAKPCVGCFGQGAEEIIIHGETGFLVRNPEDTAEMLPLLRQLLNQPDTAARLGINGFHRLHQHFTSRHHQDRIKIQITRFLGP